MELSPSVLTREDYNRMNQLARDWANKIRPLVKTSAKQFTKGKKSSMVLRKGKDGTRSEYKLKIKVDKRIRYDNVMVVESIGISIQRHGVFVHKGVGRGYKMVAGMVIRTAKNPPKGPVRVPVDWFNPIIDAHAPELANRMAEIHADLAVNAQRMRIV